MSLWDNLLIFFWYLGIFSTLMEANALLIDAWLESRRGDR